MICHFHLQIVATVLKLGNLNFVPVTNMDGTEGCRIENEYELYDVGELVKVEVDSLRSALLARWLKPCTGPWRPARRAWCPTSLRTRRPLPGTPSVAPCTPGEEKIRKEKNINKNVLQAVHTHRGQDQRGHQGDPFFMASWMFVVID